MTNVLNTGVIAALPEGSSIRAIESLTGIRRMLKTTGTTTLEASVSVAILQELRDAETA
jgi:hypothetical protein